MAEKLEITPVNVSIEKNRSILGLEGNNFIPVVFSLLISGVLCVLCAKKDLWAWGICSLPFILTTTYIVLLVNKKPPHYREDFFDKYLKGIRGFSLEQKRRKWE